jgi:hypothetical protein
MKTVAKDTKDPRAEFGKRDVRLSHYDRQPNKPAVRRPDKFMRLHKLEAENRYLRKALLELRRGNLFLEETVRAMPTYYRDH